MEDMEELGPCADVLKQARSNCFLEMTEGVKAALLGQGLIPAETQRISQKNASCFEKSLNSLGQCLNRDMVKKEKVMQMKHAQHGQQLAM